MGYRVRITPKAVADMAEVHAWIFHDSPNNALRWFQGLLEAINGLGEFPSRCPVAPETTGLRITVRQLLYGRRSGVYRILFCVREEENTVVVLRVRHSARLWLQPGELFEED